MKKVDEDEDVAVGLAMLTWDGWVDECRRVCMYIHRGIKIFYIVVTPCEVI
jgi:hypothetical protein